MLHFKSIRNAFHLQCEDDGVCGSRFLAPILAAESDVFPRTGRTISLLRDPGCAVCGVSSGNLPAMFGPVRLRWRKSREYDGKHGGEKAGVRTPYGVWFWL